MKRVRRMRFWRRNPRTRPQYRNRQLPKRRKSIASDHLSSQLIKLAQFQGGRRSGHPLSSKKKRKNQRAQSTFRYLRQKRQPKSRKRPNCSKWCSRAMRKKKCDLSLRRWRKISWPRSIWLWALPPRMCRSRKSNRGRRWRSRSCWRSLDWII